MKQFFTLVLSLVCLYSYGQGTGTILYEFWAGGGGGSLNTGAFATAPGSSNQRSSFEGPLDTAENFSARMRGYVHAPQTGNYTFWIAGDDYTELWLSTDDNPANKVKIAESTGWTNQNEWNKAPSQQSVQISLQAGQRYYIEALHTELHSLDHLAVRWQLPDATFEGPIPGSRLSPWGSVFQAQDSSLIFSTGLTRTGNTITSNLSTGLSGGQTIIGSTSANFGLTYKTTTANGTTGADHIFTGGNNGATEFMRIRNDGKVGIGTNSPVEGALLSLKSNGDTFETLQSGNGNTAYVYQRNGVGGLAGFTGTNGVSIDKINANTSIGIFKNSGDVALGGEITNSSSYAGAKMLISGSTGNVLMNTTNDNGVDKLQVNGSLQVADLPAGSSADSIVTVGSNGQFHKRSISFSGSSGGSYQPVEDQRLSTTNSPAFASGFFSGSVGIGTSSPQAKLDLHTGDLMFANQTIPGIKYVLKSNRIANDDRLIISSTGTTYGTRLWLDTDTGGPAFSLANNGVEQFAFGNTEPGSYGATIYNGLNFDLKTAPGPTGSLSQIKMRLTSAGALTLASLAGSGTRMVVADNNGQLNTAPVPGDITITTTGTNGPATFSNNVLNIPQYSGGGGGSSYTIGTGLAEVSGNLTSNLSTGVSGGQTIIGSTSANSGIIYKTTTASGTTGADHIFTGGNNGDTEFMRIRNDGKVGIGTNSPVEGALLSLKSNGDTFETLQSGNGNTAYVYQRNGVGGLAGFTGTNGVSIDKINANTSIGIFKNSGDVALGGEITNSSSYAGAKMLVSGASGNVLINTLSDDNVSKLQVKGLIKAQGIKVNPVGWSDYVFYKSYKLPALKQVEQFITINQHLPDIPSEADVKKNGIELGEMNSLLLKKIEELTLYVIEQNKQLLEQSKQLQQQSERLNKLEKK